jgi:hypothetical protein
MEINNTDTNIEVKNNIDVNNSETYYYVQQFKHTIFKCIPSKIRKNAEFIIIFTYHIAIGINIHLLDDYQKYKWKSPVLTIGPNSDILLWIIVIVN